MFQHFQENVEVNQKTHQVFPFNKEKESKHKISASCLNNCIKWELKAKVQMKKDESVINSYQGTGYYFRKLDASVLNILQNNSIKSNSNFQTAMKNLLTTSKNELKSKPSSVNTFPEVLKIKFPIDNSSFNFMIVDANLGNKDNLNNIFFLEFNLNIDNTGTIRDIDDNCVEREILFNLNAMFHDSKLFKTDLTFSVEYRRFIKSIQFRLQTYKNQIINKIKYSNKHQKNQSRKNENTHHQNNGMNFYAKILSNINIGIEFIKPISEEFQHFHTNFNSIVNSNIKINKIYLEICIPNIFIEGNNIDLGKMKIKQISLENNINEELLTNDKESNQKDLNSSNITATSQSGLSTESTLFIKQYQNDFDRMYYQQHNSPTLTIRNNLSLNLKYNNHSFFGSPLFSMKPIQNINNPHILYSPVSPMGITNPYYLNIPNQNNIGVISSNQNKFSENVYDKLRENPLSSINQQISQFYNTQVPVLIRMNNEEYGTQGPNSAYSSTKGINQRSPIMMGVNNANLPINPMTIHKRIIDWENNGNDFNKNNNILIIPSNFQHNRKLEYIEMVNKSNYIEFYKNKTNLEIFINMISPYIKNDNEKGDFTLFSYFSNFKMASLFGIKINYFIHNEIVTLVYFLTLSSMNIEIKNNNTREKVISYLISLGKLKCKEEEGKICIQNLFIIINKDVINILFSENKPIHFRISLISQIESILSLLPVLKTISLNEIESKESFFSVLYSPIKHSKSQFSNNTSFVVYYPLYIAISSQGTQSQYYKTMIIGLLPIKYDTNFFFSRVNLNQFPTLSDNTSILLTNLISNVQDKIINQSIWCSLDYEQYIKTNNELI